MPNSPLGSAYEVANAYLDEGRDEARRWLGTAATPKAPTVQSLLDTVQQLLTALGGATTAPPPQPLARPASPTLPTSQSPPPEPVLEWTESSPEVPRRRRRKPDPPPEQPGLPGLKGGNRATTIAIPPEAKSFGVLTSLPTVFERPSARQLPPRDAILAPTSAESRPQRRPMKLINPFGDE